MDREGARRVSGAVLPEPGRFVVDVSPPDGRQFWLYDDMMPTNRKGEVKPVFSIAQIAKIFFARSADWVRWLSNQGHKNDGEVVFVLDGKALETKRTESGSRFYTLADVERVAHALVEHHRIDGEQFVAAIQIMLWMAYSYSILGMDDIVPPTEWTQGTIEEIEPTPEEGEAPAGAEVPAASGICPPCAEGRHLECAVALEIQEKLVGGPQALEIDARCSCYQQDQAKH